LLNHFMAPPGPASASGQPRWRSGGGNVFGRGVGVLTSIHLDAKHAVCRINPTHSRWAATGTAVQPSTYSFFATGSVSAMIQSK